MFLCRPQIKQANQATVYTVRGLSDVIELFERHYGDIETLSVDKDQALKISVVTQNSLRGLERTSFDIPHGSYLVFTPQGVSILSEVAFNSMYERVRTERDDEGDENGGDDGEAGDTKPSPDPEPPKPPKRRSV